MANNKYQGLLNNLLNIESFDSSLFFSIDNQNFFDIYSYFGEKIFSKIYNNFDLNLLLSDNANRELIQRVKNSKDINEIRKIYNEYVKQNNEKPFEDNQFGSKKKELIDILELEQQKSIIKWKKLINKANSINTESNIWPLHVGFFIVTIKTEKKNIFAPLFFKEVNIEIKNSLAYLYSTSDIKLNEKLITFLNQEDFALDIDAFDFSNMSIANIASFFSKSWNTLYEIPENFCAKIPATKQEDIANKSIKFVSGMVLGFFNVSSGYLWNQLKKIVDNNEFEDILNPDFDKNKYKEKIRAVIFDKMFRLFKIQNTNYSQDCATVSSLYQDTIIWGPPGTGKSQTISNLIVNIIARGYTALVVSQKKAALDVLKKRLKKMSIFCLFALNDKSMRNETFYKPLKEFIYLVENYKVDSTEDAIEVFSEKDKHYVDNIEYLLSLHNLEDIVKFYSYAFDKNLTVETFDKLNLLDRNLRYDIPRLRDTKNLKKHLYEVNFHKKPHIFTIYPAAIKKAALYLNQNRDLLNYDLDNLISGFSNISYDDFVRIDSFFKEQLSYKTVNINDDLKLSRMFLKKTVEKMHNFTEEQKRQYTAFAMAIRTAHLRPFKFFHRHKEMIKYLFPVIVTTPEVDLSIWDKNEFDYAILDESSQIFIEKGIPILYLAKRKILAGDNKQMQPTRWFSASYNSEETEDFGSIESLLDYASARGVYSILLDKNYRSKYASLMTFSSKHFYDSKLDVIDDYSIVNKNEKSIEVFQTNGVWDNGINKEEVDKLIQLIKQNLHYKKIIALVFNVKQQEFLYNKIFTNEPILEEALHSDQLTIKNIENIQGDEADLVIMSVVYDHTTSLYGAYVTRKGGKNALNVAISRAKEKIIVIKSINADDVKIDEKSSSDMILFKDWLRFLDLSEQEQKSYLIKSNSKENNDDKIKNEEDLKQKIIDYIEKLNIGDSFSITFDYSIGTKNIDIAIFNKLNNKLEIGLVFDTLDYQKQYDKYLLFKDGLRFLITKQYPIFAISDLNWKIVCDKIATILMNISDNN
ncbi:DEAD/DEAH box helicase [Metamycoplasma salivarium]|uniref:DEAD/DEAH box helicase n=1 Tax=Metamycoplasma salivarium TaxID=2124 RepID=UPI001F408D25|nr:DEAD/DEAH box helicase [Metamycoplasma salivarium]GIZ06565.1 hypothetical protein MSATCC23557_5370 [Metamycoplasma salivarium]